MQHYWSLAIEEQFYLVFPIIVWLVLVKAKWSRGVLAGVLAGGFVAATAASVALGGADPDLVYYATFTRAAEVLAGCLLAMAVLRWGHPDPERRAVPWATIGGPLVLIAIIAIDVRTTQSDAWLYRGGLAAFSLLSVALIATARRPGPVAVAAQPAARRGARRHLLRRVPVPLAAVPVAHPRPHRPRRRAAVPAARARRRSPSRWCPTASSSSRSAMEGP